ncbi:hypothetical protein GQ57_04880 [Burkholderia sp. MSh2]|uniref:Uncharacterized protein n=1 Tax=Burkholderia paludis TaxID=1506587 RepID=A0A6J5DFB6_9BURK|nr:MULTISPECIES: hypothetical protein [Burkholderia]KEZ06740.1 hypothetical protein GQ57_04880 [Burkholderia sp. MSh2]KFG98306.1 hypothetical protein GQ56_0104420 [Burkholderia paludis]CAB3751675.1 hypothetical protein LMG30113_01497 [Burkholderia paludis]VWB52384.1 hypothetical protein BPA30113_02272 [Burkholderia paludis]
MHYHPDDIARLFLGVPTLRLNRPAPAERFLADAVDTGAELAHVLRDYPALRYQPLDFHYLCQQSLSVLDDAVLAALTCEPEHGWRGAHWAALLIALSGDARHLPRLDEVRRHRGVAWTAGLAEAAVRPDAPSSASRCCRLIVDLRRQLAALPRVAVRLRSRPPADRVAAQAAAVRAAYRRGDVAAALALARG